MTKERLSHLVLNALVIALFLLPARWLAFAPVLFVFLRWEKTSKIRYRYLALIPIALLSQLLIGGLDARELVRVVEIVIVLIVAGRFHFGGSVDSKAIITIILVIGLFAFGDLFRITQLMELKRSVWDDPLALSWDYGGLTTAGFRLGSIYYNPNILGQSAILLAAFLLVNENRKTILVFLPIIGGFVLLSGSRTALLVFAGEFGWFFFRRQQLSGLGARAKLAAVAGIAAALSYVIVVWDLKSIGLRAFNLSGLVGRQESGQVKVIATQAYFSFLSTTAWPKTAWLVLFGNGKIDLLNFRLDNEPGYVVFVFGLIGGLLVAYRLFLLMRYAARQGGGIVNWIWLASVGGTTLFSFRFLLIVMVLYSSLHRRRAPSRSVINNDVAI